MSLLRFDVLTLFPDFIAQAAAVGVVGRAGERGLLDVQAWNPRDYASDNGISRPRSPVS